MTVFDISIVSDTVCPWCYIGLRRLQVAIRQHLARHLDDDFRISWRPFQLKPDAPRGKSVERQPPSRNALGIPMLDRLRTAAQNTGIVFDFGGGRTGNTLDSHRLIEFCREYSPRNFEEHRDGSAPVDIQTRVVEELFADYFERKQDITDLDVLTAAAERAGMNGEDVRRFLASDRLVSDTEEQAKGAREQGISGVPHFTINEVFEVEGAQEPLAFTALFRRLKKRGAGL